MGLIIDISDAQFDELVLKAAQPALVMCTSPECIICKTMTERLKELHKEVKGKTLFFSLDVNKNKAWEKFDVRTIPTLLYFKGGTLLGRHDTFPEKKEIIEQLNILMMQQEDFIGDIKKSIEAEYIISKFYRYISSETNNGKVRKIFSRMNKESDEHRRLLEQKFSDLTGQGYQLDPKKFESQHLSPQSFSLMGAINTAIKTEQEAYNFYKQALKTAPMPLQLFFKKLVSEENQHFKELKKELEFLKIKEQHSSLQDLDYQRWMGRLWR